MTGFEGIDAFVPLWGVWQIDCLIGEGSYGKVYKAVREEFDRKYYCAIKHISIPQNENELKQYMADTLSTKPEEAGEYYNQVVKNVTDEISIMYALKGNTNIVSYEEHRVVPKKSGVGYDVFIKMELLTDLSARLKQSVFTRQDIVKLGVDICTALELCAGKNLIHRDIKPQNIFVSGEGNYKLGDFGISRTLEKTAGALSKKGTYSYMAPEVYRGEEYGASVDIYSLGLVLYRLLNGNRLPFYPLAPNPVRFDDGEKSLRRRMMGEQIPPPAFADAGLARVVLKMCAYSTGSRYNTATEVKRDLLLLENQDNRVLPLVAPVGAAAMTNSPLTDNPSTSATSSVFPAVLPPRAEGQAGEPAQPVPADGQAIGGGTARPVGMAPAQSIKTEVPVPQAPGVPAQGGTQYQPGAAPNWNGRQGMGGNMQQVPPAQAAAAKNNKPTWSLIFGILSLFGIFYAVFFLLVLHMYFLVKLGFILAIAFGVCAIVFGMKAKRAGLFKGAPVVGLVLGCIGVGIHLVLFFLV